MRVLVTGGDGFVGQHLISHLLGRRHTVAAATLGPDPASGTLTPSEADAVDWHTADVRDLDGLRRLIERFGPDRIAHLAGFSSSRETRSQPSEALRVTVEGTLNLLQAAALYGDRGLRIVVTGSADAYGRGPGGRISEHEPLRPESVYGTIKAAQEVIARGAGRALGVEVEVARLFPLVGPGQRDAFVLPSFCRRALAIRSGRSEPQLQVGNLATTRDFSDVRDGVRALTALLEQAEGGKPVYNVCSGTGTSVGQLLDWVLEFADIDPEVIQDPGLARKDEPKTVLGDPTRIESALGWRVERNLRNCVRDTFLWLADLDAS